MRLQCYEGLDEAKALYEWNYRKQLLRIQAEADGTGWEEVQDDIFGEEFLLERPLMTAIASEEPVVLLIDEIDKTDQEFEAMLLELLSDFQISIPELGRVEARTQPVVLLTSNNTRELTEALKRRCLYLWLDYPELEHELEIVRLHAPDLADDGRAQARRGRSRWSATSTSRSRRRSPSRSTGRARCCCSAPSDIDAQMFTDTMSVIVKHRTDLDVVAERVGVKLGLTSGAAESPASSAAPARPDSTPRRWPRGSSSSARSCAARASPSAPASCSTPSPCCARSPWTEPGRLPRGAGRDARQVARTTAASSSSSSTASSSAPPSWRPSRRASREGDGGEHGRGAPSSNLEALRQQIAAGAARRHGGAMRDLARLAIAAFGRQGEGSGVIGVDVQRIRRSLGLRAEPQPDLPPRTTRAATACRATRSAASRRCCAASSSAARSSAPSSLPPRARSTSSTARCRPARCRTSPPCTASSPSSSAG